MPGSKVEIKNVDTGIVSSATTGKTALTVSYCHPANTHSPSRRLQHRRSSKDSGSRRRSLDARRATGNWCDRNGDHRHPPGLTRHRHCQHGTVVTGKQISELPLRKAPHINCDTRSRHRLQATHFHWTNSNGNLAPSDPTAPRAPIKSRLTVRRIMLSMAASVSRRRQMPCRNSKCRQTRSTHSKATRRCDGERRGEERQRRARLGVVFQSRSKSYGEQLLRQRQQSIAAD